MQVIFYLLMVIYLNPIAVWILKIYLSNTIYSYLELLVFTGKLPVFNTIFVLKYSD